MSKKPTLEEKLRMEYMRGFESGLEIGRDRAQAHFRSVLLEATGLKQYIESLIKQHIGDDHD